MINRTDAKAFLTALGAGELETVKKPTYVSDDGEREFKPRATGPSTVKKLLRYAKGIFNGAVEDEIINVNPFRKMDAQSTSRRWEKINGPTFDKLFKEAKATWKIVLALCRLAGLRRNDALRLRWRNVDWTAGVLRFRAKKRAIDQVIPICSELLQILQILQDARRENFRLDDFVVPPAFTTGMLAATLQSSASVLVSIPTAIPFTRSARAASTTGLIGSRLMS